VRRSGPTAYINDEVAYPLATEGLSSAEVDMNATSLSAAEINPYFRGQHWAKPSVLHLKQLLRQVSTGSRVVQNSNEQSSSPTSPGCHPARPTTSPLLLHCQTPLLKGCTCWHFLLWLALMPWA